MHTTHPHILYVLARAGQHAGSGQFCVLYQKSTERYLKVKGFFGFQNNCSSILLSFYILTTILQAFPERRRSNASCHWSRENSWEMIMVGSTFPELTNA